MIKYKSTRGDNKLYYFSEVLLKGIACDGGLFVPEQITRFTLYQLKQLLGKTYQELAYFLLSLFKLDIKKNDLKEIINKAYSKNFDNQEITPLISLKEKQYVLELWHGPTAAFKDMALQIMPLLFSKVIEKSSHYLILVATSGDTGKAALEGFKDIEGVSIVVLYPNGHVSDLQKLQMITQKGFNVDVYAVKGDFDTVQKLVKGIFDDKKFNNKLLSKYHTVLSSANSINWGRLVPQIIYHVAGYISLVNQGVILLGDQVDIAVPTGNFGNILAAFYAKKMGLPIRKLICASNANNVLSKFLKTGVYDITRRKLIKTPSPSMDILVASNIERLLYEITKNPSMVSQWMDELKQKGKFEVDDSTKLVLQREFFADWVSNEDCLINIRKLYKDTKYLIDPHTSCAQAVTDRYQKKEQKGLPVIICSTAHWAKFVGDVYRALFQTKEIPKDEFEMLKMVCKLDPALSVPGSISGLKTKKIRFRKKYEANRGLIESLLLHKY